MESLNFTDKRRMIYNWIAIIGLLCSLISSLFGSKVFFIISVPLILVGGVGILLNSDNKMIRRMLLLGLIGTILVLIAIWMIRS